MELPRFSFAGFTSLYFVPFFLLTLAAYWLTPKKYRYISLLVCSLAFYGRISWKSLFFIAASIVSRYFFARGISSNQRKQKAYIQAHKSERTREEKRAYKDKQKRIRKTYLVLGILFNILLLAVRKYRDFFISNLNGIIHWFNKDVTIDSLNLFLPLGISFYVFQAIGYLVDVYWQKIEAEKNFLKFALFLCYFPKVRQGPIVRYEQRKDTLFGEHDFDYQAFTDGLKRALYGYRKKLVIADTLLGFIKFGFGNPAALSGVEALLIVVFYFIQDYCDFSGYRDIAIGLSNTRGITLPENFNHPYFAIGIDDYWRRWHSTLGDWFKDYIFYPLSVSRFSLKLGKLSKKFFKNFGKKVPAIFGLIVVWFTTGLWHGASWNYVLWGLYYGAIIILSVCFQPLIQKFYEKTKCKDNVFWIVFQHIRTLFLLAIGKILFRAPTLKDAWLLFAKCFTFSEHYVGFTNLNNQLGYISRIAALVPTLAVLIIDLIQEIKPKTTFLQKFDSKPLALQWFRLILRIICVVWFGFYGSGLPHYDFGYIQF